MAKSGGPVSDSPSKSDTSSAQRPSAGPSDDPGLAFKEAVEHYAATLVQLSASLQDAHKEATQDYLQTTLKPVALDPVSAAYQDLLKAIGGQDTTTIAAAQSSYSDRLKELHAGVESTMASAANGYSDAVQASWQSAQDDARTAYRNFVRSIKSAFNSMPDPSPATLALIGQSLCTAASLAVQSGV